MPSIARVAAACAAAGLALIAAPTASAAPKRITGKLDDRGYTVLAIAASGEGKAVRATPRFRVRPPAKAVTLHLRGPDGVYAGPIVLGQARNGRRAVVRVKHGAKLGLVSVRNTHARAKDVANRWLDLKRTVRARHGVPIGAGRFGLVRASGLRHSPPGDGDADGIPSALDIDSNGNGLLDRYEGRGVATLAADLENVYATVTKVNGDGTVQGHPCNDPGQDVRATWPEDAAPPIVGKSYLVDIDQNPDGTRTIVRVTGPLVDGCPSSAWVPRVSPLMFLTPQETVNANAPATLPQLDQTLAERGTVWIQTPGAPEGTVELDCGGQPVPGDPAAWSGGLSWCTPAGTGRAIDQVLTGVPPRSYPFAFPSCCDGDRDGFGDVLRLTQGEHGLGALYSPGATTANMGTGDVLNWRITVDGEETQLPRLLPDVFATVPAITSYDDDGPGGADPVPVTYPLPPPYVGSAPRLGEDDSAYQGFPVAPCPQDSLPPCVPGDVVVTFTFWRPQREPIGSEPGPWTEIGGLVYAPSVKTSSGPPTSNCPMAAISTTDSRLEVRSSGAEYGMGYGVRDMTSGGPAPSPSPKEFSFSVNMSNCGDPPEAWQVGQKARVLLVGSIIGNNTAGYSATQVLMFTKE